MKHNFTLKGATCYGCKQKIESSLNAIPEVVSVNVNSDFSQVEVEMNSHLAISVLQKKLKDDYQDKYAISDLVQEEKANFLPLILVISYVFLGTLLVLYLTNIWQFHFAMNIFMGLFFLAFSFFKFLDLKGFAYSYMSYDILASRTVYWGFLYPFIEFTLGILYLLGLYSFSVNLVTSLIMFIGLIGVLKSVLRKSKIKCVCLGTGFNLPMTYVTVIENGLMLIMAISMLII